METQAAPKVLLPIKVSFLESWRLVKLSYADPLKHTQYLQQKYGNVVLHRVGKMNVVHLFGADANRLSLLNPGQVLSNKKAWDHSVLTAEIWKCCPTQGGKNECGPSVWC